MLMRYFTTSCARMKSRLKRELSNASVVNWLGVPNKNTLLLQKQHLSSGSAVDQSSAEV